MSTSSENKRQCETYCRFYRNKFSDVPYLSSDHLLAMYWRGIKVVLVDVRSEPEQQVSMLEGSMTKEQFRQRQQELTNDEAFIVTYCTIGYRSGLEARRLSLLYPHLKDRIWSLDGVVSYTHALGKILDAQHTGYLKPRDEATLQDSQSDPSTRAGPLRFVDRQTGKPTNNVHTFGAMWGCVDDQNFKTMHFLFPEILVHLFQVLIAIISCFLLSLQHYFTRGSQQTGRRQLDQ
jgi:rhodanese-related sulfurtransferase